MCVYVSPSGFSVSTHDGNVSIQNDTARLTIPIADAVLIFREMRRQQKWERFMKTATPEQVAALAAEPAMSAGTRSETCPPSR